MHRSSEEPTPCPACDGLGRAGADNSICRYCWMDGVVPQWRAGQISEALAWRRGRETRAAGTAGGGPDKADSF